MCSSLDSLFKAEKMESLRRVIALRRDSNGGKDKEIRKLFMHRYHHEDVTLSELANYSMAKIVEANLRHARSIQHPMEHMEHAVRGNRPAGGAGKYITAAGLLLPLLLQNAYRIRPQRDGSVGILGFQRSLPHLAIDAPHLTG